MGNCLAPTCQPCTNWTLPVTCWGKNVDANHRGKAPLLLHFDVNKTVILSDSIQAKTIEQGLREGIGELFWGSTRKENGEVVWEWSREPPSSAPPNDSLEAPDGRKMLTYVQYCKQEVKDKNERKQAMTGFTLVRDQETKDEMEKLLQLAVKKMQLEPEVLTAEAEKAGLKGSTLVMFPTVFRLVALLLWSKRTFSIIFRSFGSDHDRIKNEWNAFCEMRHPVFSYLLQGIGPLDGSVPGVPDRRIHRIHTLYRDTEGPMLILDTFTNGPEDAAWDNWAKAKPSPTEDTRQGRHFVHNVVQAKTVEGVPALQEWMRRQLMSQETGAIKDDWAWWQFHNEKSHAGKLMTLIGGEEETRQLFFDDNIEHDNLKIVDCRDERGDPVAFSQAVNKYCVKVNPVEALMDDGYFARKLQTCHSDHLDVEDYMECSPLIQYLHPNSATGTAKDKPSAAGSSARAT